MENGLWRQISAVSAIMWAEAEFFIYQSIFVQTVTSGQNQKNDFTDKPPKWVLLDSNLERRVGNSLLSLLPPQTNPGQAQQNESMNSSEIPKLL